MCCKSWKTFLPFVVTFLIGILAAVTFQGLKTEKKVFEAKNAPVSVAGSGGGEKRSCSFDSNTRNLQILSKPRADYTDAARTSQTQGTVTLRVNFQADGKIGDISIVNYLPDGLTEQAVKAAKGIKFEPAVQNGKLISVTKQVQYTFTLY